MSPPSTAVVAARTARRPARPVEEPARRPPLRVLPEEPRHRSARPAGWRRRRVVRALSLLLVVGSLLAVVVGHAMLAEGQVRLAAVQSSLSAAQAVDHQETMTVAALETPSRIVGEATQRLHMMQPAQTVQLPYVPLDTPLPTPTVGPAPPATSTSGQ